MREALRTASIVSDRDALVKVLRRQVKSLKDEVYLLKFPDVPPSPPILASGLQTQEIIQHMEKRKVNE